MTNASDLLARLRNAGPGYQHHMDLIREAADTIDRLTSKGEPFGYWCECKGAEPVFLRKPAYIPPTDRLHTTTPLYASPREGHVEVPVEPTEAIIRAAMDRLGWTTKPTPPEYENFGSARISEGLSEEDAARIDGELVAEFREVYRAMLAALPHNQGETKP